SLEGKVAVVTGGSRGIGKAIALALAEAGADVAVAARGAEELERAAKGVESARDGARALAVPTDVGDSAAVESLMERTVQELGGLDILVNNAGAAPFMASLADVRLEGFEKYFRLNAM